MFKLLKTSFAFILLFIFCTTTVFAGRAVTPDIGLVESNERDFGDYGSYRVLYIDHYLVDNTWYRVWNHSTPFNPDGGICYSELTESGGSAFSRVGTVGRTDFFGSFGASYLAVDPHNKFVAAYNGEIFSYPTITLHSIDSNGDLSTPLSTDTYYYRNVAYNCRDLKWGVINSSITGLYARFNNDISLYAVYPNSSQPFYYSSPSHAPNFTWTAAAGDSTIDYELADVSSAISSQGCDELAILSRSWNLDHYEGTIRLYNLANSTPVTSINIYSATLGYVKEVEFGFMDEDDYLDMVTYSTNGYISVFYNNKQSTYFNQLPDYVYNCTSVGDFPTTDMQFMKLGDISRNGYDDVIVTGIRSGINSNKICVLGNTSSGLTYSSTTGEIRNITVAYESDNLTYRGYPNFDLDIRDLKLVKENNGAINMQILREGDYLADSYIDQYYETSANVAPDKIRYVQASTSSLIWENVADMDINYHKAYFSITSSDATVPGTFNIVRYPSGTSHIQTYPNDYEYDSNGDYKLWAKIKVRDNTGVYSVLSETVSIRVSVDGGGGGGDTEKNFKTIGGTSLPEEFAISKVYPNPFNPSTTIQVAVPEVMEVNIRILDIMGREVDNLTSGQLQAGYHEIVWNAVDRAAGVYFVNVQAPGFNKVQKIVLLK